MTSMYKLDITVKILTYHTDVRDEDGDSLLDKAFNNNELDLALFLINHGFDSDEDKVRLLWKAYSKDGLKLVKELVEQTWC